MPDFSKLTETQLLQVRDSLWSQQYYLLTGSGISLDSVGVQGKMRSASRLREDLCRIVDLPASRTLQQAYSLLDRDQISREITQHYTCETAGPTVKLIAQHPWRRIYTFNVDNCFEVAMIEFCREAGFDAEALQVSNYIDDFNDVSPVLAASVIHLHGYVRRYSDGYVFSREEYIKNISRPNSWMLTLSQLIRSEPFIIVGTSLDEVDVTYYVQQRNQGAVRRDIAPSILIEPFPDRLTEKLCDENELYLFRGTAADFFDYLRGKFGNVPSSWMPLPSPVSEKLNLEKKDRIAFDATFSAVPKLASPDFASSRFLLGAPLTWENVQAGADISRNITPDTTADIIRKLDDDNYRVYIVLGDPGSGKSSIIRRIAYNLAKQEPNVFFFSGGEIVSEIVAARVFENLPGRCIVFVDDWADHSSYVMRIVAGITRRDIIFVGFERKYRRGYIEDALADENFFINEPHLDVNTAEAKDLVLRFQQEGLSSRGTLAGGELSLFASKLAGDPIAVAGCRIQNNFQTIDRIVRELINESSEDELRIYSSVGIARYCYGSGIQIPVLYDAVKSNRIDKLLNIYSMLPIVYTGKGSQFIIPARPNIADRVMAVMQREKPKLLLKTLCDLANALAPRVNRRQIQLRSPASKLAGALMDFDRVVRRFINDDAEAFYRDIKSNWQWNSRYWEQLALLKLDRYLVDKSDGRLLNEAIQNARFAYSIEKHPLSLTTLAKMLFTSMVAGADLDRRFDEAWQLINESIDIEAKWANIKSAAFIVCFNGVLSYSALGGILSGSQSERLREIIGITHRRNLRDPTLLRLRENVRTLV